MNADLWTSFLGRHRVIVIHAPLVQWTGSLEAAMLLEELVYRQEQASGGDFEATDVELEERLFLTRYQLRTARERLTALGALAAERRGWPRRMAYRLDLEVVGKGLAATVCRIQHTEAHSVLDSAALYVESSTLTSNNTNDTNILPAEHPPVDPLPLTAAPPPEPERPASRWEPLEERIAAAFSMGRLNKLGKVRAEVGQAVGMLGAKADGEPEHALALWEAWERSPEAEYCRALHTLPQHLGRWLARHAKPATHAGVSDPRSRTGPGSRLVSKEEGRRIREAEWRKWGYSEEHIATFHAMTDGPAAP